jgi:hypothetical protein
MKIFKNLILKLSTIVQAKHQFKNKNMKTETAFVGSRWALEGGRK